MEQIEKYNEKIFEDIKHIYKFDKYGRELGKILEYGEYRKFLPVIEKVIVALGQTYFAIQTRKRGEYI